MASLISRRFGSMLLTSSRSFSLRSQSLPCDTITKSLYQFSLPLASIIASSPSSITALQKPKIPEPNFLRSSSFGTSSSKGPRKPRFTPVNRKGLPSKSEIYEDRFPRQSHNSLLEREIRESFLNLAKNIEGLKNALAILSVVEINSGAWIAYMTDQIYPSVLVQSFGSLAIQLSMILMIRHCMKKMSSLKMTTRDAFLTEFVGFCYVATIVFGGTIILNVVYWVSSFWVIKNLLRMSSVEIFTLTMMTLPFPLLCLVSVLRMRSVITKPLPGLREEWKWTDRQELMKVFQFLFHGSKRACYWALGFSSALLLNYGIVSYSNLPSLLIL